MEERATIGLSFYDELREDQKKLKQLLEKLDESSYSLDELIELAEQRDNLILSTSRFSDHMKNEEVILFNIDEILLKQMLKIKEGAFSSYDQVYIRSELKLCGEENE